MGLLSRKKGRELGGPILLGGDEGRLCFEVGLGYSPQGSQGFYRSHNSEVMSSRVRRANEQGPGVSLQVLETV